MFLIFKKKIRNKNPTTELFSFRPFLKAKSSELLNLKIVMFSYTFCKTKNDTSVKNNVFLFHLFLN